MELLGSLPAGGSEHIFSDFNDLGIKTEKIGLTDELIESSTGLKIGLDGAEEIDGGNQTDLLIGLKGKDQLTGGRGADYSSVAKAKTPSTTRASKTHPLPQANQITCSISAVETRSTSPRWPRSCGSSAVIPSPAQRETYGSRKEHWNSTRTATVLQISPC